MNHEILMSICFLWSMRKYEKNSSCVLLCFVPRHYSLTYFHTSVVVRLVWLYWQRHDVLFIDVLAETGRAKKSFDNLWPMLMQITGSVYMVRYCERFLLPFYTKYYSYANAWARNWTMFVVWWWRLAKISVCWTTLSLRHTFENWSPLRYTDCIVSAKSDFRLRLRHMASCHPSHFLTMWLAFVFLFNDSSW